MQTRRPRRRLRKHRKELDMRLLCLLASGLMSMSAVAGAATPLPAAAPADEGFSAERLQRLDRFMQQTTDPTGYLGGVVLIARNGRVVKWDSYGQQDLSRRAPMQRDSIFRIYSMTKTVTAVAVLMLLEEGRLTLDDPVARYLPEFAGVQVLEGGTADAPVLRAPKTPMTLLHLLTHTAGFSAGLPGDEVAGELRERIDAENVPDLQAYAARMAHAPLAADPGTRFGYDSASSELAARVVEVVSGMSFERFLEERIFEPLRMHDTGFSVPALQRARVVDITRMGDGGKLELDEGASAKTPGAPLRRYTSAAGGLYSTAGDYARFSQMLLNGGQLDGEILLGRKTVEMMMRNQLTMLDPPVTQYRDDEGFGLGGSVVLENGRRGQPGSPGQFGWPGAASTSYTIDPKEKLVAILLLQHLPRSVPADLPRVSRHFHALVYQGLVDE
jgi:CubicO group peptidase (beta-lactamase class C family)